MTEPEPPSSRAADARFLLPRLPRSARLVGEPPGWRDALEAAGVPLVDADPDLVVATSRDAAAAAASQAPSVIVVGRGGERSLRRRGYDTRVVVARHGPRGPRLLVPLDARAARRAALLSPRPHRPAWKRAAAALALVGLRAGLSTASALVVGTRGGRRPALLAAAGIEDGGDWLVLLGDGDDLQRCVWLCFDRGEPRIVAKWTRVPGNTRPFQRDGAVGATLAGLPPDVQARAVRHVRRFEVDGLAGVVETAAPGRPLQELLESGGGHEALVDDVARWTLELARATTGPPGAFDGELERLARDVLPRFPAADARLLTGLEAMRPVLQHNDLGSWNVLVHGGVFTVVDWESSRDAGLPLWDLLYFLTDALAERLDGTPEARLREMVALHRGERPASASLFAWTERAAAAAGVPLEAVGAIATLGWLHHATSHERRALRGAAAPAALRGPLERLAEPWLADPRLGACWPALADRRRSVAAR